MPYDANSMGVLQRHDGISERDAVTRMRAKLIEILGGVSVPDPTQLGPDRKLITQEFHLRLLRADLLSEAETRADLVGSALELLGEAARKVEADQRAVRDHEPPPEEDRQAVRAAIRAVPDSWRTL
jgi:hypothetical protein